MPYEKKKTKNQIVLSKICICQEALEKFLIYNTITVYQTNIHTNELWCVYVCFSYIRTILYFRQQIVQLTRLPSFVCPKSHISNASSMYSAQVDIVGSFTSPHSMGKWSIILCELIAPSSVYQISLKLPISIHCIRGINITRYHDICTWFVTSLWYTGILNSNIYDTVSGLMIRHARWRWHQNASLTDQ